MPSYCRGKDVSQGGSCSPRSSPTWKVRSQHLHLPDLLRPNWQSLDPQVSNHPLSGGPRAKACRANAPSKCNFTAVIGSKCTCSWRPYEAFTWSFIPRSFTSSIDFNGASHSPCKQFSCLCNRNSLLHQAFSAHELCNALNQLIDSLLPSQPVMPCDASDARVSGGRSHHQKTSKFQVGKRSACIYPLQRSSTCLGWIPSSDIQYHPAARCG